MQIKKRVQNKTKQMELVDVKAYLHFFMSRVYLCSVAIQLTFCE